MPHQITPRTLRTMAHCKMYLHSLNRLCIMDDQCTLVYDIEDMTRLRSMLQSLNVRYATYREHGNWEVHNDPDVYVIYNLSEWLFD